jgi:hypothetical protein
MWGFLNLKDVLQVVIIPVIIFALGASLPLLLERRRRRAFMNLIRREFNEMEPRPPSREMNRSWHQHLEKRFIHEAIFGNPSQNRDFILSLPPNLAYNMAQLWTQFDKAEKAPGNAQLVELGNRWCDYLQIVCSLLDRRENGHLSKKIYKPWKALIGEYAKESPVGKK